MANCIMKTANTGQRGNTCWLSTVLVSVLNSKFINESGLNIFNQKESEKLKSLIKSLAGKKETEGKLHESLEQILGKDKCPLISKEGFSARTFFEGLMKKLEIPYIIGIKKATHNVPGSRPFHLDKEGVEYDVTLTMQEDFKKVLSVGTPPSKGIFYEQILAPDSTYGILSGIKTSVELVYFGTMKYQMTLRSVLVSEIGHVIVYGYCKDPSEWFVYDNEYVVFGGTPRRYATESLEGTLEQINTYPHTYFSLKSGLVPMNPFFLSGNRSVTTLMYDFVRIDI